MSPAVMVLLPLAVLSYSLGVLLKRKGGPTEREKLFMRAFFVMAIVLTVVMAIAEVATHF
jgi:hypothetical protein